MTTPLGTKGAFRLLMEGQEALAQVEANGMRVDVEYLDRMLAETQDLLRRKEDELKQDAIWQTWTKYYGSASNLDSGEQLGRIIFDVMEVPCASRTPTGKPKTDEEALEKVKCPFIEKYVTRGKLYTARNTFLMGIKKEVAGGYLHPNFSLNTTVSYRSSSSLPNAQNFPNRIDRTARLVRSAFIPRSDDHVIVEFDLKGAEVCVSACYHKDPTMIEYINRGHDYHKDLACQCYMLEPGQVQKIVRNTAKGSFVFASFYGDWYRNIAENLWNAIDQDKLTRVDGIGLKQHLADKGIYELGTQGKNPLPGTFEAHIKGVYDDFWGRRFPVYSQWKVGWFNAYLKNGYCKSLTGFTYQGEARRNEILNYCVQGSSFHCLLWSLIQLNGWLTQSRMRTKVIGQIHDSVLLDVHKSELDEVLSKSAQVMRKDIRQVWDWIIVPLDVECYVSPKNWYEKEEVKLAT